MTLSAAQHAHVRVTNAINAKLHARPLARASDGAHCTFCVGQLTRGLCGRAGLAKYRHARSGQSDVWSLEQILNLVLVLVLPPRIRSWRPGTVGIGVLGPLKVAPTVAHARPEPGTLDLSPQRHVAVPYLHLRLDCVRELASFGRSRTSSESGLVLHPAYGENGMK